MPNISDLIENFIIEQLTDGELNLSRNELANFFNVAPSQINYVLATRFTPNRGYDIESRRGGGGFIKISKVDLNADNRLCEIIAQKNELTSNELKQLVNYLNEYEYITDREKQMLQVCLTDKALANPIKAENKIRSNIVKNMIMWLLKEE